MAKQQNLPRPSPLASGHTKTIILNLTIAMICLVLEVCVMEVCSLALRCSSSVLKLFAYERQF